MARLCIRLVSPLLSCAEWLFGRRAAGIDLALGCLAVGWCCLMVAKPAMFDRPGYAGFAWLPDAGWIALSAALAGAHGLGLQFPAFRGLRAVACLGSSWLWIFVALSLGRVEIVPGVINCGIVGIGALFGAIHVAGRAPDGA